MELYVKALTNQSMSILMNNSLHSASGFVQSIRSILRLCICQGEYKEKNSPNIWHLIQKNWSRLIPCSSSVHWRYPIYSLFLPICSYLILSTHPLFLVKIYCILTRYHYIASLHISSIVLNKSTKNFEFTIAINYDVHLMCFSELLYDFFGFFSCQGIAVSIGFAKWYCMVFVHFECFIHFPNSLQDHVSQNIPLPF